MSDINNYNLGSNDIFDDAYKKSISESTYTPIVYTPDPLKFEGLKIDEYKPWLGEHLLPDQDLNRMRAEKQGPGSEVRNALFNLPGSIVGGIVENAGYMGALLTEWGDDRDYTNSWTEAGKGIKEWWKSNVGGEIYRKNPEKVWDIYDTAWWVQNAEGLVESIGEFAVTGYGIGSVLGKTANALATSMKASAPVARGLMNTAQVGTAASLAYTEGAMTGAQVYKDVYSEEYEKQLLALGNQTEAAKRAKHKAATAAATAVHINTSINTLLNIGSVGTLFRSTNYLSSKAAESVGKKNAKRMLDATARKADDKLDDIITRTSNLQYTPNAKGYYADLGIESLKEGVEEQVNLFAEESGMRVGKMDDEDFAKYEYNNWSSYLNQFEQLSHFAKDVFTEEGALNFVLGAAGGIGQTMVMNHRPTRVTDTDPTTGQKTTRWTTARAEQILREQNSFNKLQDSVVSDLRTFNKLSTRLDMLMKDDGSMSEKDREKLIEDTRQELFDLEAYRSIRNGTGDYLKGTFEYIGNLDNSKSLSSHIEYNQRLQNLEAKIEEELAKPQEQQDDDKLSLMKESRDRLAAALNNPQMTQAMFEGYAEKPNTDTHKKRADKAIKEIDNYTKMYHDVMSTYNYGDERTAGLARTLFDLKLQSNTTKRKIERNRALIDRHKESLREKFKDRYKNVDSVLADAASIQANIESLEKKLEEINEGLDNVMLSKTDAERQVYIDRLAAKYPNEMQKLKSAGLRKADIEKALIKIEDANLKKETKDLQNQKDKLSKEKQQLLITAFEASNVINPQALAENISQLSEDQIKLQREDYIKQMERDIELFNASLDNDLQAQYDDIIQNELDNKFMMEEYAKLASSKGRKEFVENGKKFFEKIKEYSEQKEKEAVKKQEKEEAKKKGYYTIEKTADGKFGLFDKTNKLVDTFDTEEDAIKEAEKLNKKIDEDLEAKRKKDEETKKYTHIAKANREQHAKNLTFLNDILDDQRKVDIERRRQEELNNTGLYEYDRKFKEFQTYGSTVREAFDNLFEKVKNNPSNKELSDLLDYINDRLIPEDIEEGSSKNSLVQEYIDQNQQNIEKATKSSKSAISKINAKYDEELKSLKETSEDLSDAEYDDFVNNKIVTKERIEIISEKIATGKADQLTERERAILDTKETAALVNEYLIKRLEAESNKVKSAQFTIDEFIKKYTSYEYKDATGNYSHMDFLDRYLDLLKVAGANGTIINVINDPNEKAILYAKGKNIYVNLYHLNHRDNKRIIDNKYLSELFVHETIHTFVGNALVTNKAFFTDMRDLILSMGKGSTLAESFDKIKDNIKVDIDRVFLEPDSEDKKKRLDILRRAITVIDYCKRDTLDDTYERLVKNGMDSNKALLQAEQLALEEFITQSLSEPEFAFYLNTIPSDNVIEGGPSMSVWQVLKKMLLELINTVLNNRSKLQELNSILDKHLAKTTDGFNLANIQSYFDLGTIAELGIYTHNNGKETRDIVILSIEGDDVIYTYPALLMDPSIKSYKMNKDQFFNGNPTLNENFRFEEFVKTMDKVDFKSDDINKIIEREKNQNYYKYLSIATKSMFDQYVKDKFDAVQNDLKTERLNELINSIEKQTNISEIQGVLNIASKEFDINSDEFKLLSNKALETINKISKTIDSFDSDNYIKLAKLTEFDDSFKHIFVQLDELKERLTNTIFNSIDEDLKKTSDLKKLQKIRKKYKDELKKLKNAYNNHLKDLTGKPDSPLSKDDYEIQIYINDNSLNNLEERLERRFISRLSDDDVRSTAGVEYAQIINEDGTVDKRLFTIVGINETGYVLVSEDNISGEVEADRVINLSNKHNFSKIYTSKEEIFDENYPRSILFDKITTENLNPQYSLLIPLEFQILNNLRNPISKYQEAAAKATIINMLPAFLINNGDAKQLIKDLVDKVSKRNDDGKYVLTEDQVKEEIRKVVQVQVIKDIFNKITQHDAREVFTSFLSSLTDEERNSPNFNNKIRVTVSKSTKANKLRNKMKSDTKDNIDEKIRIGLIKMNESKHEAYNNKEEVIGIHGWDDITVDYEIKIGNKWVRIGSARNPYAYKAIKMEPFSEINKSPAHLYEKYLKATTPDEKNAVVEEFNKLYSIKGQVVDSAKFESIGEIWLKQKKLYDALSKQFKDSKKDKLTIEGDALSNIVNFEFTGGDFNFTKNPKFRTSLNDTSVFSGDDVEVLKIDTDGGKKIAIIDMKESKTPSEVVSRYFDTTIDGFGIDGLDMDQPGKLPKQDEGYGRYWLVTKDLTGQFRFLWVKPRRIKESEYDNVFAVELKKLFDAYNKGTISKEDLGMATNSLFKQHVYLSLPAIPRIGAIQVFLNLEFSKDGKTINKNSNGSYKFTIRVRPMDEGATPLLYLNDIDLTNYNNFTQSLYNSSVEALKKNPNSEFKPLTADNVRISFDEGLNKFGKHDGTTTQDKIMDVFEIPVSGKVFNTNRLLTNVSDDISFETEEGEPEIDLDILLASDELTAAEKELFDSSINENRDAANIINFTKEKDFFTDKGNTTVKRVKEKLKISTDKGTKEALDLLVEKGFLNKKGNNYSLNKEFGKVIEPLSRLKPEEEIEETGIDLSEIKNKLLKVPTDKLIARSFRNKIDEQEYKDIVNELVSNSNDQALREQAINMLISYYQDGKYIEAIDGLINDIKLGKMTEAVIDDPDLIRRKLIGCPKF